MKPDLLLDCPTCGVRFVWTAFEQRGAAQPPDRCPACRRMQPAPGRQRGVVKFFNPLRGWGFVVTTAGQEIFVHRSGLVDPQLVPHDGDLVEFAVEIGRRGPHATALTLLEGAEAAKDAGAGHFTTD